MQKTAPPFNVHAYEGSSFVSNDSFDTNELVIYIGVNKYRFMRCLPAGYINLRNVAQITGFLI